jgi:predicted aconitase
MNLTPEEQSLLNGDSGPAVRKAMEILVTLGTIYGADRLIPVTSVQISGVSYDNLGDAGLEFLAEMADGGGRARVLTTLNPAGMDIENWQALGISPEFAQRQQQVIAAFTRMGVTATCTCTPYLVGNLPHYGEHIAWAESSAVCFANSVIGARTNREGGPSALAASLTGLTPAYGFHLDENRPPGFTVRVKTPLAATHEFGALGIVIGRHIEKSGQKSIPYIQGIPSATLEQLKSLCASLATFGGAALFHIEGITPEFSLFSPPEDAISIARQEIEQAIHSINSQSPDARSPNPQLPDFYSLGCPHLSIQEIASLARLLEGRHIRHEFWITTARTTKAIADRMGYTRILEAAGALFAADTCCVVAPIRGRFRTLVTDSAKACYYASSRHNFNTRLLSFEQVVEEALK